MGAESDMKDHYFYDMSRRVERQDAVYDWVKRVFGRNNALPVQRMLRFVEEAVELAQAFGMSKKDVIRVVNYVYKREPGEVAAEVGGVGITLLALCEALGVNADDAEVREIQRVLAMDVSLLRARHNAKAAKGIARRVDKQ